MGNQPGPRNNGNQGKCLGTKPGTLQGVYTWLPLGLRTLRKIEDVVRQEMDAIGGQEMLFPALLPREPYEKTNRWVEYGDNLFRLKDRKNADMLLGPTHEEMFALSLIHI